MQIKLVVKIDLGDDFLTKLPMDREMAMVTF